MKVEPDSCGTILEFPPQEPPARRRLQSLIRQFGADRSGGANVETTGEYPATPATPREQPRILDTEGRAKEIRVLTVGECEAPIAVVNPFAVASFFRGTVKQCTWFDPEKECMVVLLLDRKNRLKAFNLVSLGSAVATAAGQREIYRAAVVGAAAAIILIHNHPSGDPAPSMQDKAVTKATVAAGSILDIPCLDHVIVGDPRRDPSGKGMFSFRLAGMLQ